MALERQIAGLNGILKLRDEEGAIAFSIAKRFLLCLLSKSLVSRDEALDIIAQAANADAPRQH